MHYNFKDITGKRFKRLKVFAYLGIRKRRSLWGCSCSCGKFVAVIAKYLINGDTKSCGCINKDKNPNYRHGHRKINGKPSPTYNTWYGMKQRCSNPKNKCYKYYGARGISVCSRWLNSFENFLEDMGERPEGLTLDRIDNNGNYEPDNCRWATAIEQEANKHLKGYLKSELDFDKD